MCGANNCYSSYPRANEYKKKSWSGTGGLNCTDPKQLFESITKQPWELIRSIKLNFRETQNKTSFEGKSIAKAGNITDINFYGRCFSIIVSPEIQRKGVSQMIITSKAPVTILYSTPGRRVLLDWLHQAQIARQNHTRRSQMKKLLVPSGFLDQKFEGNLKEVGQIVPNSVRILL